MNEIDMSYSTSATQNRWALIATAKKSNVLWLLAVGVLAGIVFPLTNSLAGMQDGDGILASLISTQKLTWYFWGQDRLLSFMPALAAFVANVEWNLRVQLFLRAFFAFLAPVGILYFFNQSARFLTFAVVLTNLLLALALNQFASFNYYVQYNTFETSLVMFALSFAVLRINERSIFCNIVSLLTGFIAYASYLALPVIIFPLIAMSFCFHLLPRKQLVRLFVIHSICVVLAYMHSKIYGVAATQYGLNISLHAITAGYTTVADNVAWIKLSLLGLVAVILYGLYVRSKDFWSIVLVAFASIGLMGVLSCSVWAQMNGYNIRYYLMPLVSAVACISCMLSSLMYRFLERGKRMWLVIGALMISAWLFGLHGLSPSYSELVGPPWRDHSRAVATEAITSKAQLVIGDYWGVWPAVFDTYAMRSGADNRSLPVYGAAFRGYVLRKRVLRLSSEKGGIRALCLVDSTDECTKAAISAFQAPVTIEAGSLRRVIVDNVPMLMMTVQFSL